MLIFCEINIPTKEITTGTLTDRVVSEGPATLRVQYAWAAVKL